MKGILNNPMQIRTIRKGFKAFEAKFEAFEMDSKHSNANPNLNHSKGIRTIPMQILTFRKGFEAFEKNLKHWNANSNHLKGIQTIQMHI